MASISSSSLIQFLRTLNINVKITHARSYIGFANGSHLTRKEYETLREQVRSGTIPAIYTEQVLRARESFVARNPGLNRLQPSVIDELIFQEWASSVDTTSGNTVISVQTVPLTEKLPVISVPPYEIDLNLIHKELTNNPVIVSFLQKKHFCKRIGVEAAFGRALKQIATRCGVNLSILRTALTSLEAQTEFNRVLNWQTDMQAVGQKNIEEAVTALAAKYSECNWFNCVGFNQPINDTIYVYTKTNRFPDFDTLTKNGWQHGDGPTYKVIIEKATPVPAQTTQTV